VPVPESHAKQYPWFMRQDGDVRTGRHRVFALHAHLVFVTKYRHPVFTDTHLERMGRSWGGLPRLRRELVECNGETGHVHLLVRFPRPWRCRGWSTASRASPPGGCVRSSPNWPDTTGGRSGCGPGRTLPGRWAVPRWTFSAPTSSSRTGLATRFTPRLKAGALPRGAGSGPGMRSRTAVRGRRREAGRLEKRPPTSVSAAQSRCSGPGWT
jgi:hypothetical protein